MIDIEQVDVSEALNHIVRLREMFKVIDKAETVLIAVQAAEQKAKQATSITDAAEKKKQDVDSYVAHHQAQIAAEKHAHHTEMNRAKENAERDAQAQMDEIAGRIRRAREDGEAHLAKLAQDISTRTAQHEIISGQVKAEQEKLTVAQTQLATLRKAVA